MNCCVTLLSRSATASTSVRIETTTLEVLALLTHHDFGMWLLRNMFDENVSAFFSVETLIVNNLETRTQLQKSHAFDLLRSYVLFAKSLCDDSQFANKSLKFKVEEVISLFKWKTSTAGGDATASGQICAIREFLKDDLSNETSVEALKWLNVALDKDTTPQPLATAWQEPAFVAGDSLATQFATRAIVCQPDSLVSTGSVLDLQHCTTENPVTNMNIEIDLRRFGHVVCGETFDLHAQLLEHWKPEDDIEPDAKAHDSATNNYELLLAAKEMPMFTKKPFTTSTRGRGYGRQSGLHSTRVNDPFRSRPPNTSRPPSMHVDDFVAMESREPMYGSSKRLKDQKRASQVSPTARTAFAAESYRPLLGTHPRMPAAGRYGREDVYATDAAWSRSNVQTRHPVRYPRGLQR